MNSENTSGAGAKAPASSVPAEEWREIPGYDGWYEASTFGRIRSWKKCGLNRDRRREPRILSQWKYGNKGHLGVSLCTGTGIPKKRGAHQAVAEAFIGPRPKKLVTCHNNGDPTDNRPDNLRYDTYKGNEADKIRHGTHQDGARNHMCRLSESTVRSIFGADGTHQSIATRFGVARQTVGNIKSGTRWTHLNLKGGR